jgi:hypothetical protein
MSTEHAFTELAPPLLSAVTGGADDASLGRCGPGSSWQWMGDVRTPECLAHDQAVRGEIEQGTPKWLAHVKALPSLPAAAWSYVREVASGN